jgi:UDP-N-acetyl-D-glucosamine dehydrogenase
MGLREDIASKRTAVGVIGLGYVGLPMALAAADAGFEVIGLEKERDKRMRLMQGEALYEGLDAKLLRELIAAGRFRVSGDPSDLNDCKVICACVPTPLSKNRDPDLCFVEEAAMQMEAAIRQGEKPKLVIIESTSYPGTTRDVVEPILVARGLKSCFDFHLAYSPERVDPGNKDWDISNTPRLIGGVNECCGNLAESFYSSFVNEIVRVSSPEVAETAKVLENIFRGVNIALVNELWMLCDRMGIDVWEVIRAAASKPFGFMPFWPGPGLGGHCIPVDPFYLAWKAREYDFQTEFIELAGKVNLNMPYFVADLVSREMNRSGKHLKGSRALVVGVAYKPNVGDTRETPATKLIELLRNREAEVIYHDPHVPTFEVEGITMQSVDLNEEVLAKCDCAVIVTAHSSVDYGMIARSGACVVDTRNVLGKSA